MPPTVFSGALNPKKKAELQEIANSLHLSDQGTKEELQARIKKYLDTNPSLEDEPTFAGLFGRKKKSTQPSVPPHTTRAPPVSTESEELQRNNTRSSRRTAATDPVAESTPYKNVSTMLKEPFLALRAATTGSPVGHVAGTGLRPESPFKNVLEVSRREVEMIVDMVKRKEAKAVRSVNDFLVDLRTLLSNSRNFWTLTALLEVAYILRTIIPWKYVALPLSATAKTSAQSVLLPYPPMAVFQTTTFWLVLFHWALPTLVLPWIVGILVSYQPTTSAALPFDPLTASITRLAAHSVYPYSTLAVKGVDVLGSRTRILSASVGVAFAFAEAIAKAPATFHSGEKHSSDIVLEGLESVSR